MKHLRTFSTWSLAKEKGIFPAVLQKEKLWAKQKEIMLKAFARFQRADFAACLLHAQYIDILLKGKADFATCRIQLRTLLWQFTSGRIALSALNPDPMQYLQDCFAKDLKQIL